MAYTPIRLTRGRDDVAVRFGLPEGVDDGAAPAADVFVVPHPRLGVDRLAHATQQAQAAQVKAAGWTFSLASEALMSERMAVGAVHLLIS